MLNQDIVLTLIQTSITCAGLVLAIYTLIIPFSKRVFEHNIASFLEALKYTKNKLDEWFKDKEVAEKAKGTAENIVKSWSFPTYLRFGVGFTFSGYILTTLFSIAWIVDWGRNLMDLLIVPVFVLTTLIFLFVGVVSIKDVHEIMREDFKQIIESLKKRENETQTEES